jgi:protein tyrosine/serine phosphatase
MNSSARLNSTRPHYQFLTINIEGKTVNTASEILYQSVHPVANKVMIKTVINIPDSKWGLEWKATGCTWYKKMFETDNVIAINILIFDILDREFYEKLKEALSFMTERNPPYLTHCGAGSDRTGFLSITSIIEAFMGDSMADMTKGHVMSFAGSNEYSSDDYRNGSVFVNYYARPNHGGIGMD